jgi:hypothetical protein
MSKHRTEQQSKLHARRIARRVIRQQKRSAAWGVTSDAGRVMGREWTKGRA